MPELGVGAAATRRSKRRPRRSTPCARWIRASSSACIDLRDEPWLSPSSKGYRQVGEAVAAKIVLEIVVPDEADAGGVACVRRRSSEARAPGYRFNYRLERGRSEVLAAGRQASGEADGRGDRRGRARGLSRRPKLGGGMLSTFTELNRKRPKAELFDYVTHTTCSIVHAADDRSVMETLETLPAIIASTRAMIGDTPYRIGPSAIAARSNPYGKGLARQSRNGRVCLTDHDPRQRGLFNAAWTLGYVAACAYGGVERSRWAPQPARLGSSIDRAADYPQPYFDSLDGPAVYPAFHVMAGLARGAGRHLVETQIVRAAQGRRARVAGGRAHRALARQSHRRTADDPHRELRGRATASERPRRLRVRTGGRLVDALDALRRPLEEAELNLDAYAVARVEARQRASA